jgi:Protein of unknown function with HXXEE motif
MAGIVGLATWRGLVTQGASLTYRLTVEAFGLHGIGHLAASGALRDYTPGVATTPSVVLPYTLWAGQQAGREFGPVSGRTRSLAAASIPVALAICHLVGAAVDTSPPRTDLSS